MVFIHNLESLLDGTVCVCVYVCVCVSLCVYVLIPPVCSEAEAEEFSKAVVMALRKRDADER